MIFSDLEMPAMDGYEMAATLKENEQFSLPLVALTSLNSDSVRNKASISGFDEFILKHDSQLILKTIEKYTA